MVVMQSGVQPEACVGRQMHFGAPTSMKLCLLLVRVISRAEGWLVRYPAVRLSLPTGAAAVAVAGLGPRLCSVMCLGHLSLWSPKLPSLRRLSTGLLPASSSRTRLGAC